MQKTAGRERAAYLCCVIAMVGWGSNFVASKIVYRAISGLTLLFLRYLIALAILLTVYRKSPRPRLSKTDRVNIFLIGAFGYCFSIALQMMGTKLVDASMASIINTITPVSIIVFALPILGEKPGLRQAAGIGLTILGSFIIVGSAGGESAPLGIFLSFTGMALWGLTSVMIRKSCANVDGIWVTIYGTLVAMVLDIPLMAVEIYREGIAADALSPGFFLALVWIGAVATAGANLWWNQALAVLPAATCSLFYAILPVVTAVLGFIVLHEKPTLQFAAGCAVIIAGVVIAMLEHGRASVKP